jgi:hypothetical protein
MSRPRAFTQKRKMLRWRAISQQRRWIAFLMGVILLLALEVWLGFSHKAHVWLAGLASTMSWILTHALPEVLILIGVAVVLMVWLLPEWQAERSQGLADQNRFDPEKLKKAKVFKKCLRVLILP